MIQEVLDLGFTHVELGYDLPPTFVPAVRKMVDGKAVTVNSVHAFCPMPYGTLQGHPELFSLADPDRLVRESAVSHLDNTIRFAEEIGAPTVILHGGNIAMRGLTRRMIELYEKGQQFSPAYEKTKVKLIIKRDKRARKHLDLLYSGIEMLLPILDETNVRLAFENTPSWESIPSESELAALLKHFNSPHLGYWHDIGHGEIRRALGFVNPVRWLQELRDHLAGMHVHDLVKPASDHIMPPAGQIDFALYAPFAQLDIPAVFEPRPGLPAKDIVNARNLLASLWGIRPEGEPGQRPE